MKHEITLKAPSNHVILAPLDYNHNAAIIDLRTHPETRRYLPYMASSLSTEEAQTWLEKRTADPARIDWFIFVPDDEGLGKKGIVGGVSERTESETVERTTNEGAGSKLRFAGQTSIFDLDPVHRSCETGILLDPSLHRHGIATTALYTSLCFAFEGTCSSGTSLEYRMHRIMLRTSPSNVRMRGLLEKFGFVHEFTFREAWKVRGEEDKWEDTVGYTILESEWVKTVKPRMKEFLGL